MQSLEWSEESSVGIPQMDAQHRHLFELLAELRKCVNCGASDNDTLARKALQEAIRYAEWHLRREELLLRLRGYPDYAKHKAEHDSYREKVVSLQAQADRRDLGIRIANFLAAWWTYHIQTSDQHYARFFRSQAKNR